MAGAAQGAALAQASYARIFNSFYFRPLALLLWGLLLNLAVLQAQTTHDILDFPFEIDFPEGTLAQGDTVLVTIRLGDDREQVDSLLGFNIFLKLSDKAEFAGAVPFDLQGSWLADDENVDSISGSDASSRKLTFKCDRNDGVFRSGAGEIFAITLVATEGNVDAESMVSSKGGLVVLDNTSFKQSLQEVEAGLPVVFPVPDHDIVNVRNLDEVVEMWWLEVDGHQAKILESEWKTGCLQLPEGSKGMRLLFIRLRDGRLVFRRVLMI